MPLYPLGISRSRDVPSVPRQDAGAVNMRWSLAGELACAFIDAPHQAVPPMLHATALEAIHRRICVLPVRFGVALRDEAEIRALLQERRHELLDHLSRLDWTCEMGLRITPPSPPETSGCRLIRAAIAPGLPRTAPSGLSTGRRKSRARPFAGAAVRGAAARLLSAMAKAAILPVAPDPAGISRRTRPRDRLSQPCGARPAKRVRKIDALS